MRCRKRMLTMLLVLLLLPQAGRAASGFAYKTISINGLDYKLSNTESYQNLPMVSRQAKNLYAMLEGYPQVATYVYLINSSRTVDVLKDVTAVPAVYEEIRERFSQSVTDYLRLESLEQYAAYYYTTDHHWNYQGSYAGYCQIIRMLLGEEEPVLEPAETVTFPVMFNGSMNKSIGRQDSQEPFTVYRFDFPEMKIEIDGHRKASFGNQKAYFAGNYSKMAMANHYAKFYGGDNGLVHVETERTDRGNLLVFSNSFANAVTLLLASHFHHLWVVDMRYFEPGRDQSFRLSDLLKNGEIDRVLLLGDGVFFTQNNAYQKLR